MQVLGKYKLCLSHLNEKVFLVCRFPPCAYGSPYWGGEDERIFPDLLFTGPLLQFILLVAAAVAGS
jgi:hypothetical protein